ncbi:hypothetical protein JAO73_01020 [Hymenobacter sp. BT523]|uniref:hypothetical protein n=1 Tax=Hymenobacter sp. BT523 TaxID=2795725 RepID=UPI0018EA67E4|nr:hypothetical protein [Hymenobacter sp. BT523]MBJ6107575.1 hypothetical protein [Hymenobacter sp. BT523]
MILNTIASLSLQYDEALSLLRVEWAAGEDMRAFRSAAEQLLEVVNQHSIRNILLEMNTFPEIAVYDQVWLGVGWMPALVKLPIERMVLAINRRHVHNQLAIDSLIALFRPFIKFDIQFFSTAVPGLHWLSDYSNRVPGLLAEWDAAHGRGPAHGGVNEPRAFYQTGLEY